jgi:lipoprotein-anchoring transpeptidase ErfK/SrfK
VRNRSFIAVTAFLAALFVIAGAVYAFDASREDRIAEGISVGGVDVGGMTRGAAAGRLERALLGPLREPIVVNHDKRQWKLGPREARIAADVAAMVDEAVARSRSGGVVSRTWRDLTGGRVDDDIAPEVSFSRPAVLRLIDRIRRKLDREAKDASVKFSPGGVARVAGHDGLKVEASALHRRIRAAIVSPTAERTLVAHTRKVRPKVTTQDLEDRYPAVLIVNRSAFKLTLYKRLKPARTYPIAVGKAGLETPAGLYNIANKAINPAWHVPDSDWAGKLRGKVIPGGTPENPIKSRWLGVYDGVGVHGTSDDASIGTTASHGCIRMHIPDIEALYPEVPVGAPIYIA